MERLVKVVQEQLKLCRMSDEVVQVFKGNETNIRLLIQLIENCQGTIGEKKHLETVLGQLKSLRLEIKRKLRTGKGLRDHRTKSVEWEQVIEFIYLFIF